MSYHDLPTMRFTHDELIEALEARRKWAVKYDRDRLAAHKKAEQEALKKYRAKLREALKLDYETIIVKQRDYSHVRMDRPNCPTSMVAKLDRALNVARSDRRKSITINPNGHTAGIHDLLTRDETIKDEMC